MSDYWTGLVNYKQKEKQHRYFRAEVDSDGEAKEGTIVEVNFIEERDNIKEQIQEDIITYLESHRLLGKINRQELDDELCQIVVNNFKGFE